MNRPPVEELRVAIRELLAEEMARLREEAAPAESAREERVSLRNDAELGEFVRRLGVLYADPATRADIDAGRHRFRLSKASAGGAAPKASGDDTAHADRLLVSEREVTALPAATRELRVAKQARVTPLARDALRRRGITITRSES